MNTIHDTNTGYSNSSIYRSEEKQRENSEFNSRKVSIREMTNQISQINLCSPENTQPSIPTPLMFGKKIIPRDHIFFHSVYSVAIVNLKPIVPYHVLVISKQVKERISNLSENEFIDLFRTQRIIQEPIQSLTKADAFNFSIQDGEAAGQSMPHVHLHILPRKAGDFKKNDEVYNCLETQQLAKEWIKDESRRPRTNKEMTEEATTLRTLFKGISLPID